MVRERASLKVSTAAHAEAVAAAEAAGLGVGAWVESAISQIAARERAERLQAEHEWRSVFTRFDEEER